MNNAVNFFTGNHVLNVTIFCWFLAQFLKIVFAFASTKKLNLMLIFSSGGMPSSHTSSVVGLTTAVAFVSGFFSVEFAICVCFSCVVMYDATGVRREAGKQAAILNYIMDNWNDKPPVIFQKELKELIGHTPFQVLAGAILGFVVGILMCV